MEHHLLVRLNMKHAFTFLSGAALILILGMAAPRVASTVLGLNPNMTTSTFVSPSYIARQGPPAGEITTFVTGGADASSSNVPFLVYPDEYYLGMCNAAACVGPGAYASCTYGDPTQQPQVSSATLFQLYVPPNLNSIAVQAVSGDAGCTFWQGSR
jgi:hypothetical protein